MRSAQEPNAYGTVRVWVREAGRRAPSACRTAASPPPPISPKARVGSVREPSNALHQRGYALANELPADVKIKFSFRLSSV